MFWLYNDQWVLSNHFCKQKPFISMLLCSWVDLRWVLVCMLFKCVEIFREAGQHHKRPKRRKGYTYKLNFQSYIFFIWKISKNSVQCAIDRKRSNVVSIRTKEECQMVAGKFWFPNNSLSFQIDCILVTPWLPNKSISFQINCILVTPWLANRSILFQIDHRAESF